MTQTSVFGHDYLLSILCNTVIGSKDLKQIFYSQAKNYKAVADSLLFHMGTNGIFLCGKTNEL